LHQGQSKQDDDSSSKSSDSTEVDKEDEGWPAVWNIEMWQEKKQTYPWLCCADGLLGCEYCRDAQSLRIFAVFL
jgi:hypothetical protein